MFFAWGVFLYSTIEREYIMDSVYDYSPTLDVIENRKLECIRHGWKHGDEKLHSHAVFTLGIDNAINTGEWPCKVMVFGNHCMFFVNGYSIC